MKRSLLLGLLFVGLAACAGCPVPTPTPPSAWDGGTADTGPPDPEPAPPAMDAAPVPSPQSDACARACANLLLLGCPEGAPDAGDCAVTCRHVQDTKLSDYKPDCLAAAGTITALRACKAPVKCLGK